MSDTAVKILIILILLPLIVGCFFFRKAPLLDGWWHDGALTLLWFIILYVICLLTSTY